MDSEIKISELTEATEINEEDIIPIVQNGANKKINMKNLFKKTQTAITTDNEITANTNYTIPIAYILGANMLEIFYEGCKLIKGENYIEVGTEGNESTTIQFKDWDVPSGSKLEFIYK